MARSRRTKSGQETPAAKYWRARIEEWESSGLTQAEFCRREKLSLPSLSWWKWKLTRQVRLNVQPKFLPVRLVDVAEQSPTPSRGQSSAFEVALKQGYIVRIPEHFDSEALLRLLKVLEASRC